MEANVPSRENKSMTADGFAARLGFLTGASGKSLGVLSREIGVSKSALCRYVRGQAEPGLYALARLAAYFKVPIDHLVPAGPGAPRGRDPYTAGLALCAFGQILETYLSHGLRDRVLSELVARPLFEGAILSAGYPLEMGGAALG